ncbi:MAG TPA: sigma-54 dependent transcriptional regulator [Cytophagaceae bacterium]|nr:sigma-54 dependent transcriptional regulator [Cytophagaceae bacterium]
MSHRPFKITVVEDNEWYNKLLVHSLSLNPDFEIESYTSGKDFLARLSKDTDVVTLDYRLPDMNGNELLKKVKEFNEEIEVIVISEQENIETAVELLKAGAYDYIVKEKDIRDRLLNTVNNIRKKTTLKAKVSSLQEEIEHKFNFQNTIIGNSESIKRVFTLIEKAVNNNITVTITGETGTGKEVVAKAIHYNSKRKDKPFVAVNISAIPSELIESELFGHEKGAFTGATFRRVGKFEEAAGGTLFLDEIGEMETSLQSKLLRALQEKEITRVGSNELIKTDCRIIVATNKSLKEEVKKGNFREDLYFRLFGLPIELPPLRERKNDILILAKYFLENFCRENEIEEKILSPEAQKKLLNYDYPGNIRELKASVELAIVMSNHNQIGAEDILLSTNDALTQVIHEEYTLREYDIRILNTYLKKYDNNINLVAEKLDISPSTIYRMMKEEKERE